MRFQYPPYVPVAERQRMGTTAAANLAKRTGRTPAPVRITGRAIATTFWGKAWCDNLEAYSDYSNRLPRGRTYARNGSVVDLHITPGTVEALVQGSSLYKIQISFTTLAPKRWADLKQRSSGHVTNLLDLLQGRLSKEILADLTHPKNGLFPAPAEIKMSCSCPDWAGLCKHLAAVLYGVGARLDEKPELFFTLRGVDVGELIASATTMAAAGMETRLPAEGEGTLAGEDLSALFGVDLDVGAPSVPAPKPAPAAPVSTKRAASASRSAAAPKAGTKSKRRSASVRPLATPRGKSASRRKSKQARSRKKSG